MTERVSRIQILAPERLAAIIAAHQGFVSRQHLAEGLLRLLELHTQYIANVTVERPSGVVRVGTWIPDHRSTAEIGWTIFQDPAPNGFTGQHILTGGLVRHDNGIWGIHT